MNIWFQFLAREISQDIWCGMSECSKSLRHIILTLRSLPNKFLKESYQVLFLVISDILWSLNGVCIIMKSINDCLWMIRGYPCCEIRPYC